MVVALGALQLHAHEQPRRLRRGLDHFVAGCHLREQEVDGPVFVRTSLRRDQVVDDLIPGAVLGERLSKEFLNARSADLARRLAADREIRPEGRPIPDVGRVVEHFVDERGPLVRALVLVETVDLLPKRNVTVQVQRHSAEPLFVVGRGRRNDLVVLPACRICWLIKTTTGSLEW